MMWLQGILNEIVGLFVDDGIFAFAVVLWLMVLRLLTSHGVLAAHWGGFILFGGLVALLAEGALRFSRSSIK